MLVTFGLTPAIQRVMVFDRYRAGEVNRAVETVVCPAGKAINAARAARIHSARTAIVAISPQGGPGGIESAEALERQAIVPAFIEAPTPTRTCVTVIDQRKGSVTELVEESRPLPPELIARAIQTDVGTGTVSVVLCAGSLTPGCSPDVYARVLGRFPEAVGIVDAKGPALLAAMKARTSGWRVAKLNKEEICETMGERDVEKAMSKLQVHGGATHVIVTDGKKGVWVSDIDEHFIPRVFSPPRVKVVNTTGCGDCLAGVVAMALAEGAEFYDAVELGIAASAASAETLLPSVFDPLRMRTLLPPPTIYPECGAMD